MGAYRFDPALDDLDFPEDRVRLEAMAEQAPETGRPPPYLVQLERSPDAGDHARLRSQYGLLLSDYVDQATYLERLSSDTVTVLTADPLVRAVVPYYSAFRVEPEIAQRREAFSEAAAERFPEPRFVVIGFAEASAVELRRQVEAIGLNVVVANEEGERRVPRLVVEGTSPDDAATLARLPEVRWVEGVGDVTVNNGTTSWVIQTNVTNDRAVWGHALRGDGQIIGHIDGPVDVAHCFFRDAGNNTPRPAHRKVVAIRDATGSTTLALHGTFTAGCALGEDVGADALAASPNPNNGNAPRSKLTNSNVLDLDIVGGPRTFRAYLDAAHADGARIHTNSWDDKSVTGYTQVSVDLDAFTWDEEDDLAIIGPNNLGTIHPPDTAKNALVVNSTRRPPNQNDFSAGITQFTPDGRRKPDLMAPGEQIVSADRGTPCGTRTESGTSAAAPAVAGAAALVRQYYLEGYYPTGAAQAAHALTPTGALLKATLLNGTVDATGIAGYPGTAATGEGWGRLLLEDVLFFSGQTRTLKLWDVRHARGLEAGQTNRHKVKVTDAGQRLKVTLVFTDAPATAGSATPVVNNLNLSVEAPNGSIYLGNQFTAAGESQTGGAADALNNVEMVILAAPATGTYTIRVTAATVAVGKPHADTGRTCVGYAVVVSGAVQNAPCFVAGAVYGGQEHRDVRLLRRWRDEHSSARTMRALIAVYDRIGPPLAHRVERRPRVARALRCVVFAPLCDALRRREARRCR